MAQTSRPLAVVTGASTGIGYELSSCCAQEGFDPVVVADEPGINKAGKDFEALGAKVAALQADLAEVEGIDKLYALIGNRPIETLFANAGRGLGKGFLDQNFNDVLRVINTNITGTVYLIQKVGKGMRKHRRGRIRITGSIAGFVPGTYQAVYNASKAFLERSSRTSESWSLASCRAQPKRSSLPAPTCSIPRLGQRKKDDAADVARTGFEAMMKGEGDVVTGWHNKLQSAIANVTPASVLADQHRKKAEPGSAAKP